MDNKKIAIYIVGGLVIAYAIKKYIEKQESYNSFTPSNYIVNPSILKDIDINNSENIKTDEQEQKQGMESISFKDSNIHVYRLKKIINYFYQEPVLEENEYYDAYLLEMVQDLLNTRSPALIDYKTGKVCVNFISNLHYIVSKASGYDVTDMILEQLPDIADCEVVAKGDVGNRVLELQKFINFIAEDEILVENQKYSLNMRAIVRDYFANSNVIRQDASSGVCYRFLSSATIMFKNISQNLNQLEEQEETKNYENAE